MVAPILTNHNYVIWQLLVPVEVYKNFIAYGVFLLEKIIFVCNHLVNIKFSRFYKNHRRYLFIYDYMELLLC